MTDYVSNVIDNSDLITRRLVPCTASATVTSVVATEMIYTLIATLSCDQGAMMFSSYYRGFVTRLPLDEITRSTAEPNGQPPQVRP